MSNLASVQFVRSENRTFRPSGSPRFHIRPMLCNQPNYTFWGKKIQFLTWEMPLAEEKKHLHTVVNLFCFSKQILVRFLKFWDHQQGIEEDNAPNLTSLVLLCKSSTNLSNDEITPQTIPFPSIPTLIPSLPIHLCNKIKWHNCWETSEPVV